MSNSPKPTESTKLDSQTSKKEVTPWNCLVGAILSGSLGLGLYKLTTAIALTYANKPLNSSSNLAMNISSAVRTLVVGVCALGAGLFAVTTLGLLALGIQILFRKPESATGDS